MVNVRKRTPAPSAVSEVLEEMTNTNTQSARAQLHSPLFFQNTFTDLQHPSLDSSNLNLSILVMGASGDLAKKVVCLSEKGSSFLRQISDFTTFFSTLQKTYPALFALFCKGCVMSFGPCIILRHHEWPVSSANNV